MLGSFSYNIVSVDHLANIIGEELVPDPLHLAAELQVGQVPSVHHLRLQLEVFSLSLEIEERHILGALLHCVRHHRLAVDPEEAATIAGVGLLEHQLLVAQVEELVELLGVLQSHHQVLGCERLLSIAAVCVLQVDFIQQF